MKNKNELTIYNCHAHCFVLDHAPDYFARDYFPVRISKLRKYGIIRWLIKRIPGLKKSTTDMLERLINLLKHGNRNTQQEIIDNLRSYYPPGTKFVLLTMDMEYMNAEKPEKVYMNQMKELAKVKKDPKYKDVIYPFIFADPRRIRQEPEYLGIFNKYLSDGIYQGIKLYPALGYWPFDPHLKKVYQFAIEHDIPLMYHCAKGVVHARGKYGPEEHPVSRHVLPGKKSKEFTTHYTHPVNYECLLNPEIIGPIMEISRQEAQKFSRLKICIGHFGGDDEWIKYLTYPWLKDKENDNGDDFSSLEQKNWNFDIDPSENQYSWFSLICDLIKKYENVYADISYSLYREDCLPLLKVILESNEQLRNRILFGTDFYVVSKAASEREYSMRVRGYLGEELFWQIAHHNPKEYLRNNFNSSV
jgi:predicted TIM-barrel fold metal-dependent hydrolase